MSSEQQHPYQHPDLSSEEQALARQIVELRQLQPSVAFRQRLAEDLQRQIGEHMLRAGDQALTPRSQLGRILRSFISPSWSLRMRLAVGFCVVALLIGGAFYSSRSSLPGDLLYPLKRSFEAAQATLSTSDQLGLRLDQAALRLDELARLVERGDAGESIRSSADEYRQAILAIEPLLTAANARIVAEQLAQHLKNLQHLEAEASPSITDVLRAARLVVEQVLERAREIEPLAAPPPLSTTQLPAETAAPTRMTVPPHSCYVRAINFRSCRSSG